MGKITARPIAKAIWQSFLFWLFFTGFGVFVAITAEERFVDLSGYLKLIGWTAVSAGGFMAGWLARRHGAWHGGLTGSFWGIAWLGFIMIIAPQSWPLPEGTQFLLKAAGLSAAAGVCGVNLYHASCKETPGRRNMTLRQ
ncbi:MAG: hypothetical protein ACOY9Y_05370 [Bacillota bacterium]